MDVYEHAAAQSEEVIGCPLQVYDGQVRLEAE